MKEEIFNVILMASLIFLCGFGFGGWVADSDKEPEIDLIEDLMHMIVIDESHNEINRFVNGDTTLREVYMIYESYNIYAKPFLTYELKKVCNGEKE